MAIKDLTLVKKHLFLCNGGTCKLKGAEESAAVLRQALIENGLGDSVHTTKTLCNGRCKDGPVVISMPDGTWFKEMTSHYAQEFICKFLIKNITPYDHRLYAYGEENINTVEPECPVQSA